jgi:hypothetical protein
MCVIYPRFVAVLMHVMRVMWVRYLIWLLIIHGG